MRHLDLFSGIGGFALAAGWAGYETVQFVEIDPFCQQVLAKHWPEVPCHDDIRSFDGARFQGQVQLLTGGFPCQPYSVAGKRGGASDDRALWPQMRRVIDEARPAFVVAENVPGFIGLGLDDCLADLEGIGYEVGALVVPAAGVGAPHRRDRLWIVAHANRQGEPTQPEHDQRPVSGTVDVAHAPGEGLQGQWPEHQLRLHQDALKTSGRGWWATEPQVCRVAHGLPRPMDRLRALGNAIVPAVAYEIIRHLAAIDRGELT